MEYIAMPFILLMYVGMIGIPIVLVVSLIGDGLNRFDAYRKGYPQPPATDPLDPVRSERQMHDWDEKVEESLKEYLLYDGPMDGKRVRVAPKAKTLKVGTSLYSRTSDHIMAYRGQAR